MPQLSTSYELQPAVAEASRNRRVNSLQIDKKVEAENGFAFDDVPLDVEEKVQKYGKGPSPERIQTTANAGTFIPNSESKLPLHQYEGYVNAVSDGIVYATIEDIMSEKNEEEEIEIPLSDFNRFDRENVRNGTVFYWIVSRNTSRLGTVEIKSSLMLKRAIKWSKKNFNVNNPEVEELHKLFNI
jgi:hypothetical protein